MTSPLTLISLTRLLVHIRRNVETGQCFVRIGIEIETDNDFDENKSGIHALQPSSTCLTQVQKVQLVLC